MSSARAHALVYGSSTERARSIAHQQMVVLGTCCTRRGTKPTNSAPGPPRATMREPVAQNAATCGRRTMQGSEGKRSVGLRACQHTSRQHPRCRHRQAAHQHSMHQHSILLAASTMAGYQCRQQQRSGGPASAALPAPGRPAPGQWPPRQRRASEYKFSRRRAASTPAPTPRRRQRRLTDPTPALCCIVADVTYRKRQHVHAVAGGRPAASTPAADAQRTPSGAARPLPAPAPTWSGTCAISCARASPFFIAAARMSFSWL